MECEDAVKAICGLRGEAVIVGTMTALRWLHQHSPSPLNLSCVPFMGGASTLALGIALAQPERRVVVLDGDGSLLMQLGSLVTIAGAAPANYTHFVFQNGVWFEDQANLSVPGQDGVDFCDMARAAGYRVVKFIENGASLENELPSLLTVQGPVFAALKISPRATSLWSNDNPQPELPDAQFTRMGEEARALMSVLGVSFDQPGQRARTP